MDPNANLQEQERILTARRSGNVARRYQAGRLRELRDALATWLHGGGFQPDWSKCPLAADYWRHMRRSLNRPQPTQPLTQVEFNEEDFSIAEHIARKLGYKQTAYTSTSALWGLFCLPENPQHTTGPTRGGCVIKTRELGFLFVQDTEDLHIDIDAVHQSTF